MRSVRIFTGTDLKSLRPASGKIGYVLETQGRNGPVTRTGFDDLESVTKNQAELIAIEKALTRMTEPCEITIFTESSYVAAGMEWAEEWKKNGWITARGKPVSNQEEWKRVLELMKPHKVTVENKQHEYSNWIKTELSRR